MQPAIWIAIIGAVLSCYFAACHIALKTFSRKRLADWLEPRGKLARVENLSARLHKLQLITAAIRTVFVLATVFAVLYAVESNLPDWDLILVYLLAFAITAGVVSLFAVAIPASWARYRREPLLARSLPLLNALLTALMPVAILLDLVDPVVRRVSGADLHDDGESDLSDEVLSVVEDHDEAGEVDEEQKEMLEAVFDLPNTDAGEIMTPRTDVEGIPVDSTLIEVKRAILDFGHSRIPVYEESLDQIVGILYAKDLIEFVGDGEQFKLRDVLREPLFVPASKSVSDLLREFKTKKIHIAIVLDEYGGTAGLVTIEDILEEIVGEVQDEYDQAEQPEAIHPIDGRSAEVDARVHVDDLNDHFDADIPDEEGYDTVGGFVIATLGHIPEAGETFDHENLRFTVTQAERTRVVSIKVERLESASVGNGDHD